MQRPGSEKKAVCAAVVPAAGSSSRMKGTDKLFYELDGVPVLVRCLLKLQQCEHISEIVVATREEMLEQVAQLCAEYKIEKVTKIVKGGESRLHSVLSGVRAVDKANKYVAVHDAARPFVTDEVIGKAIAAAVRMGAAAPAVPVKDTVKRAENNIVKETPKREELFAVQTPQVFDKALLLAALGNAVEKGIAVTDDCSAVEAVGMSVYLTEGDYNNIKITTPDDFIFATALLEREKRGENN